MNVTADKKNQPPMKVNDVIRITTRMRDGTETATAWVTHVERMKNDDGWAFNYQPCDKHPDSVRCVWGCSFMLDEPGEWGVQAVEVIGHQERLEWHAGTIRLAGNPGYDLMM